MRLFEAIVEANHRAMGGDKSAGLHLDDFAGSLPVVALTCIDPRLDPLLPEVLGLPAEQFIWLRNAGNIITGPLSSTMRSLALACAIKGGREIAIIGHSDCRVRQTTTMQLLSAFQRLGVDRSHLPENLAEFFGLFASEPQNVIKACGIVRSSPLIGPMIPVHGLMVDVQSGRLEWLVNGYQTMGVPQMEIAHKAAAAQTMVDSLIAKAAARIGDVELGSLKIGELASRIEPLVHEVAQAAPPKLAGPPRQEQPKEDPKKKTVPILQPWKSSPWRNPQKRG